MMKCVSALCVIYGMCAMNHVRSKKRSGNVVLAWR